MKNIYCCVCLALLLPYYGFAQNEAHFTMFMYNKLLYNPAYAGSRDVTSVNADDRDQWNNINGAPKTLNLTADGPVGSYMGTFRKVALGISLSSEQIGVEKNTNLMAYYAYRIKFKNSVLSFGLSGGGKLYSANYSELNPYQQYDPNLTNNIKNEFLPNFGAGVYWSADRFYAGFSVPNLLEDYYDKIKINDEESREIRGYYLNCGYVFTATDIIKIQPQILARYSGDAGYSLPVNCDFNVSVIAYDRLMFGLTYRTDKSFEGIVHVQATRNINVGFAYDYLASGLNGYSGGTYEVVVGYDFVRDNSKYAPPRFVRTF